MYLSQKFFPGVLCEMTLWKKGSDTEKSVTCGEPPEVRSRKGCQPIKCKTKRDEKVAFPLHPQRIALHHLWQAVCNLRASVCHGTRGCLCPRTIRVEFNQGETSPQQRQLFCGNNKTKGSAGTSCPLDWRSGGCCFQQSTCVFISVSFACVCLSFLINRGSDPDYIYTQAQLHWSRRWPILLTLQTTYQHLSFSQETEDTYQAHQRGKGGRAAGVVHRGDNNSSPPSLHHCGMGWDGAGHDLASLDDLLHPTDYPAAPHRCSPTADYMISPQHKCT